MRFSFFPFSFSWAHEAASKKHYDLPLRFETPGGREEPFICYRRLLPLLSLCCQPLAAKAEEEEEEDLLFCFLASSPSHTHTHKSTNFFLPHPKSIVHPPPPPSETHESRPPSKLPRRCCYYVRNLCAHASFSRLFTNISSFFISTGCSYRGLPLSARPAGRAGAPGIGRHTGRVRGD